MPDSDTALFDPQPDSSKPQAARETWRSLVGQIGAEVAAPLNAAMERIHILTGTGRIDRRGLRALRNEVEAARQVGLVSQQIAKLASGETTQSPEHLQLVPIARNVIFQRARDFETHGLQVRQLLQAVEVRVDATLLFNLLNTVVDWAIANAQSHVEIRTEARSAPLNPRLSIHFAPASLEDESERYRGRGLDSLTWRLLQHLAKGMGLVVTRHADPAHTELNIEFPESAYLSDAPFDPPNEPATSSAAPPAPAQRQGVPIEPVRLESVALPAQRLKPLIGSHVLVAASRKEIRLLVRESIKNMGLIIDFVTTMEEAADFCRDGLPHALIYEAALAGPALDRLRKALTDEAPSFVFIELSANAEDGKFVDCTDPCVDEAAITTGLPGLLVDELSKTI